MVRNAYADDICEVRGGKIICPTERSLALFEAPDAR